MGRGCRRLSSRPYGTARRRSGGERRARGAPRAVQSGLPALLVDPARRPAAPAPRAPVESLPADRQIPLGVPRRPREYRACAGVHRCDVRAPAGVSNGRRRCGAGAVSAPERARDPGAIRTRRRSGRGLRRTAPTRQGRGQVDRRNTPRVARGTGPPAAPRRASLRTRPATDRVVQASLDSLSPTERSRVTVVEGFAEADKASIFDACDVFALPSIAESSGIVYLEAWLCAKPVIGARIGAVQCVIEDGRDGLLVDPVGFRGAFPGDPAVDSRPRVAPTDGTSGPRQDDDAVHLVEGDRRDRDDLFGRPRATEPVAPGLKVPADPRRFQRETGPTAPRRAGPDGTEPSHSREPSTRRKEPGPHGLEPLTGPRGP